MRFHVIKGKNLLLAALLVIWGAVLIFVVGFTANKVASAKQRQTPVYSVAREDKAIALSFDVAWGDETTDAVLSVLKDADIRATFFFVGSFVKQYPESVSRIVNAGHEIADHSMTHADPKKLTYEENLREIDDCAEVLQAVTGVRPRLFRAPSGAYTDDLLAAAESLGMTTVQWSADSLDWKYTDRDRVLRRLLPDVAPGGILLFHLGKAVTVEVLPEIIDTLKKEGYTFVPVGELLLKGDTYVDGNGVQRKANER